MTSVAQWLNAKDQRTLRDRPFGQDTVRGILCNSAYCGYVSGRRGKEKTVKGVHEAIVEEALFDRVQEMRSQRARTLKPGRPSERYLLRGLARCERCQAKIHGTGVGSKLAPFFSTPAPETRGQTGLKERERRDSNPRPLP